VPHIHAHLFNRLLPPQGQPPPNPHTATTAAATASSPAPHAVTASPWMRATASSPAPHAATAAPWMRLAHSSGCLPPDHIAVTAPWIEAATRLRIEGSLNFKRCEQQSLSVLLQVETKVSITSPCSSPRAATVPMPMPMPMPRELLWVHMVRRCERRAREPEA
jgi:hypothetical protein